MEGNVFRLKTTETVSKTFDMTFWKLESSGFLVIDLAGSEEGKKTKVIYTADSKGLGSGGTRDLQNEVK